MRKCCTHRRRALVFIEFVKGFIAIMARAITKGMSSRDVDLLLVALGRLERFYRSDRTDKSSKSEHTSDSNSARRMGDEGRA